MSRQSESSTGDRDLKGEATIIKEALTSSNKGDETRKEKPTTTIDFTTLAQSVIPGNFLRKRLGNSIFVDYIPDFYYIMELCQVLFVSSKQDKALHKAESVNIQSFTLYMAHTLLYVYLRTVQECNPPAVDLSHVLTIYQRAGFDTNQVPAICSHWIDGLGKYTDPSTKKTFRPVFPVLDQGAILNSGFFSGPTGHLLPNIYCILSLIRISAHPDTNMSILNPASIRSKLGIFGSVSTNASLINSTICRSNAYRVPGCKALCEMHKDIQLLEVVESALTGIYTDTIQNILKVTPLLLSHLKRSQDELFSKIDTITIGTTSPTGTALTMLPLISTDDQEYIISDVNTEQVTGLGARPAIHYHGEVEHKARLCSRVEVVNGHADYAYQTPLVRITGASEGIITEGFVYQDPQSPWYSTEHEFFTEPASLLETRAYFKRKN